MGGNLIRKPNQLLINSLSSGDVSLSDGVLRIKQYGNDITLANVTSFTKVKNASGTLKVSQIQIRPVYPSTVADGWEGGIEIKKDYQFTGDPQDFYGLSKPATHYFENFLAASSGYMNPLDCVEAAGNMVEIIQNDPDRIVDAALKVYVDYTGSGTLAITDLSGNVLEASSTVADVAALVALGAASDDYSVVADGTDGAWITASEGLIITGESSKWDVTYAYFVATQKELSKPFTLTGNNVGSYVETINTAGVKETLPLTEVQRTFPFLPGQIAATPHVPLASTAYTKCVFNIEHSDAAGLTGANRKETAYEQLEVFLPTTVAEGSYWSDIFYAYLPEAAWTVPTFGATSYTNTGASGAGAGTMTVTDQPGFVVSTVQYYKAFGGTGTIDETTGVIASCTDGDVFYAEIDYAHLDYLVVSKLTVTTVADATFTGAKLTSTQMLEDERIGVFDCTLDATGFGTPVLRNYYDLVVETQTWTETGTIVIVATNGEITTKAANNDTYMVTLKHVGSTTINQTKHTFVTGHLDSETVGPSIPY